MRRPSLVMAAFVVAVLLEPGAAAGQDVAAFYDDNCASCHTIGGGPEGGPDLASVTTRRDREWLIQFLLDPEAFASDPEVVRMIEEADGLTMPATEGLTRELAVAILDLIEQRSGAAPEAVAARPEALVTAADVARGRRLFIGSARLSGGGPACVACHEAGEGLAPDGGRLGPDLALVHDRLGGRRGLVAWLGTTPSPMMRALYRPAPLTRDESHALAAFVTESAAPGVPRRSPPATFTAGGLGGAAAALVIVGLVWGNRFRAVRRPLVASVRGSMRVGRPRNAPGAAAARTPPAERAETNAPGGLR
jgi:mono/diheme cytochrome c family protein